MNKIYSFIVVALVTLSFSVSAQTNVLGSEQPFKTYTDPTAAGSGSLSNFESEEQFYSKNAEALGDTIYEEDWANGIPTGASGWTNVGAGTTTATWEYRGSTSTPNNTVGSRGAYVGTRGPIQSATAANGFVIFDSDYYDNFGIVGGQGGGLNPIPHDGLLTSPNINLTGYTSVILTMTQYLRMFTSQMIIEISDDNFVNNIDTVYNADGIYAANTDGPTNEFLKLDVSAMSGGANFKFRFRFTSTRTGQSDGYYFWMVDDIRLMEAADFDLTVEECYYGGAGSSNYNAQNQIYYTRVPESQANMDTIDFGVAVGNNGNAAMTNTVFTATVTGPSSFSYTGTSTPTTLAIGAKDSLNVTTRMTPNGGIGRYDVTFDLTADSLDDFTEDNMKTDTFRVTSRTYARDNSNPSGGIQWNQNGDNAPLVRYDVNALDSVVAIDLVFYNSATNTAFRTDVNSVVEIGIWAVPQGGGLAAFDLTTAPLASIPFYTITASTTLNDFVRVPLPSTLVLDPAVVSEVIVGYRVRSGYVTISNTSQEGVFNNNLVDNNGDNQIDFWTTNTFPIRLIYAPSAALCAGRSYASTATVNDAGFTGSITLDASAVTGPSPLSYSWTGPMSYTATTKDLTGLANQGAYTVEISDADGCKGTGGTFTVAGCVAVTVNDGLSFDDGTRILSTNPSGGTGAYTFLWSDGSTGESLDLSGSQFDGDSSVYNVTITDANGCSTAATSLPVNIPNSPRSVNESSFNASIDIFPNPNEGKFEITASDLAGEFELEVIDMVGKVVYSEEGNWSAGSTKSIDLANNGKGIYLVNLTIDGKPTAHRVVLK